MNPPPLALGEMLDAAAARRPDTPAIIFKDTRVTYAELAARADAFARSLLALGLGPGDHAVLWMPNSIEDGPPSPPNVRSAPGNPGRSSIRGAAAAAASARAA